ncbi:MAG: flagellar assembly protein FliW [Clostridia bacterium]|nr:flagellar assembly protein FliW [Clostridia bacterium]
MNIITSRFGEIQINEDDIINFPQGILGFEDIKRFIILSFEEQAPFKWLQALDDSDLAFVIAEPFLFFSDYEFDLSDEDQKMLEGSTIEQLGVYVILLMREKATDVSANLMAPIVVNLTKRKAKQVVLYNEKYSTKHCLFT